MATFTNAWNETIPEDDLLSGLSEAGKIDELIRQLKLDIHERILKYCPVGFRIKWASDILPPGFKECNGASLVRLDYPLLFGVIGTIYGAPDATHFNLPDHRGYFARGWNHGKASGLYDYDVATRTASTKTGATMTAGDHVGTSQLDENDAHVHTYKKNGVAGTILGIRPSTFLATHDYPDTGDTDETGTEARPINKNVKFIIRVDGFDDADYARPVWDETEPINTIKMGRIAMELRKLKKDIEERMVNFLPAGMIIYWPSMTLPYGHAECDGSFITIASAPDLFDYLGDIYGPSDGTSFYLPDYRGYYLRGQDGGAGIDSAAASRSARGDGVVGDYVGTEQTDAVKLHKHSVNKYGTHNAQALVSFVVPSGIDVFGRSKVENHPTRIVDGHPQDIYLMPIIRTVAI